MPGVLPRTAASVLVLTVRQSHPPLLQETLQHQQVGLVQSPLGSLLLPLGPDAHSTLCVPCKSGVSVSPSPVEVLQSNPANLQSLILQEFLFLLLDPQFGKPDGVSEPSLQLVDFCGIIVLQFVSHTASSYGIRLYCDCAPPTISLWLLLCLWMGGIFFGEFQCLPVDDCSAVSCDSGVLARGSESTSFYSATLNQSQ